MLILQNIICLALLAAFSLLLLDKIGLRQYIVERCPIKIFARLFACDFCLSFWTSVIIATVAAFWWHDLTFLALPFFSVPLTRILL